MDPLIQTSVAEVYKDEFGIIRVSFPEQNVLLEFSDSQEIFDARITLSPPGTKQLILADIRTNPKPDRKARDFSRRPEMVATTKGMAMLVGNSLSRMLGNFFIGFNRGDFPVKLFLEEEKATEWLLSL